MNIFLSYSIEDQDIVYKTKKLLIENGFSVLDDNVNLSLGESISSIVENTIENADAIIFFMSQNSSKNEWFNKELSIAISNKYQGKSQRLLPVKLDGNTDIPFFFDDIVCLDLTRYESTEEALNTLINSLNKVFVKADVSNEIKKRAKSLSFERELFEIKKLKYEENKRQRYKHIAYLTLFSTLFSITGLTVTIFYWMVDADLKKFSALFSGLLGVVVTALALFIYRKQEKLPENEIIKKINDIEKKINDMEVRHEQ